MHPKKNGFDGYNGSPTTGDQYGLALECELLTWDKPTRIEMTLNSANAAKMNRKIKVPNVATFVAYHSNTIHPHSYTWTVNATKDDGPVFEMNSLVHNQLDWRGDHFISKYPAPWMPTSRSLALDQWASHWIINITVTDENFFT